MPISGAQVPTTSAGDQRELHVLAVERPGQRQGTAQSLQPDRQVVGVHAEAHAGGGQFGGRAVEGDRAAAQEHDTRSRSSADAPSSWETSDDRRAVLRAGRRSASRNRRLRLGVDAGHRLVEHQQVGSLASALAMSDPLLLAARQLGKRSPAPVGEADRRRGRRSPLDAVVGVGRRHQPRRAAARRRRPRRRSPAAGRRSPAAAARSRAASARDSRPAAAEQPTVPACGR